MAVIRVSATMALATPFSVRGPSLASLRLCVRPGPAPAFRAAQGTKDTPTNKRKIGVGRGPQIPAFDWYSLFMLLMAPV
jgi:hypothetical protein